MDSFLNRSKELPPRYIAAIQQLSTQLWRRFPSITDPADRDNCIERTLQRVADYEEKHGEAPDLPGLIWYIFPQVAISLLRKSRYKLPVDSVPWATLDGLSVNRNAAEEMDTRLYAAELLASLDDRVAEILHLRFFEGLSVSETAQNLGMSEANVRQICHRAVQQLRREQQPQPDVTNE